MGTDNEPKYVKTDVSLVGPEHVRVYRETKGEVGHIWNGVTTLLLTTIGRKSGEPRIQPMIYGERNGRYYVIASYGGAPKHPAWYQNLSANPDVEVQVKDKIFSATAVTLEGEERAHAWDMMVSIWPNYEQYEERTDRVIPVVSLIPKP